MIINNRNVSETEIKEDLIAYARSKPDLAKWVDWLESSTGTTVAEWIAGLGAFRAFHDFVLRREATLARADYESSIYELAFNRGYMAAPSTAAEFVLTLDPGEGELAINLGDLIATLDDYQLYAIEAKTISGSTATLRCAAGHLNEFSNAVSSMVAFRTFSYTLEDKYACTQLEQWAADGTTISLLSDVNYLKTISGPFVLRRILPGKVQVFTGNGTLGWHQSDTAEVTYRTISYGDDIKAKLSTTPVLVIDATMTEFILDSEPTYAPTKEEIRGIAKYYPLDGRIVQDVDYDTVIMKFFGGVLKDVYSYNTDPNQQVYLIGDTNLTSDHQTEISEMVDLKRGSGIQVLYTYFTVNDGQTFNLQLTVDEDDYYSGIVDDIREILDPKLYTFMREDTVIKAVDLAVEVSAELGIKILPAVENTLTMEDTDFLNSWIIEVNA